MGRRAKSPDLQMRLDDRYLILPQKAKDAIRNSRLGHFGDEIFPLIDPDDFLVLYTENGRGPSYLQGLVGLYLLHLMLHSTADELMLRVETDISVQYALHTTSLEKQPFSRRNYFLFMSRLDEYEQETGINLIEKLFEKITLKLVSKMGLNQPGSSGRITKRMDSLMINTNAARLTRPGIIYAVNHDALVLYRSLQGMDHIVPSLYHYFDESDCNSVIYHNKDGAEEKIAWLLEESKMILSLLEDEEWHFFQEYRNLTRVFEEQTKEDESGERRPKCNHEIEGTSLQTPKDPDATARTKSGRTYVGSVGNITETYNESGDSLITDADIQSNSHSDSDFMKEYVDTKPNPEDELPNEITEEQVITDGAYYSSDNSEAASEKGILIVPTSLTGSGTPPLCSEFELSDDGKAIIKCPNGEVPQEQHFNEKSGRIDAKFSHEKCDNCPLRDQCPGKDQKRSVKVSISEQMVNRADMQNSLGTDEHKQLARERNAVEGIPSVFRRYYGIDRLKTIIKTRVKSAFFGICLSYNCRKHQKFMDKHRYQVA